MDAWLKEQLAKQGISNLTTAQQLAVDAGVTEGRSMVICAPTSSGKTLVGELAILAGIKNGHSALYLVSHKALADQKYAEFKEKYGVAGTNEATRIALSTGDREEGDDEPQILIATYEKALSLVMTDVLPIGRTVVVADELQLIGEDKRGPEVEILCAALRRRKAKQFVALTATVQNGDDLKGWLECDLVHTSHRDVQLIQEIWTDKAIYRVRYGDDQGAVMPRTDGRSLETLQVLNQLLAQERGPVLVFVETRADAMKLAASFSKSRAKTPGGFNFADQLSLFAEATEFSDRLLETAETKVVFHTADLTPSERSVVEQGLVSSDFDACFATPTLAAGVNFPFRTVLFDRIKRRYIPPPLLPLNQYRNMSGRAGRLGHHDDGYCILVPRDQEELTHANILVKPENENLFSKLASMSVRKIALSLIASRSCDSEQGLRDFMEQTLFWYQVRDRNRKRLEELVGKLADATAWLVDHEMVLQQGATLTATEFGATAARSGLLPSTAHSFKLLLSMNAEELSRKFEALELPLLHAACCCDEFDSEIGQRFLPSVALGPGTDYSEIAEAFHGQPTLLPRRNAPRGNAAFSVYLFASGESERRISARSGIPSGQVHRFAGEIAWILDGMARLAGVPSVECPQVVMNNIRLLARRVRAGVPAEVVDLLLTAQRANVPGFGRQRALALLKAKLADRQKVLDADRDILEKILSNKQRADRLIQAIERTEPSKFDSSKRLHCRIARQLGLEALVNDSYEKYGIDYETPIEALLRLDAQWKITKLDDGRRQGVPDLMIQLDQRTIVLECKSTTKRPPTINKEEAFAVLTKATDIKDVHRVTLGKPGFDTFSESKACGSSEITLVTHAVFIGAILLRRKDAVSLRQMFDWLCEPGVAELDRLGILAE